VAAALLAQVQVRYAERLGARYKLPDAEAARAEELLASIGRKRGALMAGGRVNLQKAAEIVINDFRAGAWGRVTLETPDEFGAWRSAGMEREAERLTRKRQREAKPVPQRDADRDPRD
jgi:ribosome biogenesis GTPase A